MRLSTNYFIHFLGINTPADQERVPTSAWTPENRPFFMPISLHHRGPFLGRILCVTEAKTPSGNYDGYSSGFSFHRSFLGPYLKGPVLFSSVCPLIPQLCRGFAKSLQKFAQISYIPESWAIFRQWLSNRAPERCSKITLPKEEQIQCTRT